LRENQLILQAYLFHLVPTLKCNYITYMHISQEIHKFNFEDFRLSA